MTDNIDTIAQNLAGGLSLDELRRKQSANIAERYAQPVPEYAKAALRSYWDTVFSDAPKERDTAPQRLLRQEMPYDDARKKFFQLMKLRAAHIAVLRNNEHWDWDYHPAFAEKIRNLIMWIINDPTSPLPLHKGLFVYGQTGTGKTEVMQCLERFAKQHNLSKQFTMCSMSEQYDKTRADQHYDPRSAMLQFDRCFDEFGRHVGPVLRFGDPLDVNETIIEARYIRFQRYGQFSHFTANTTPNELEGKLSAMVFDRLRSMCSSVYFPGESRREHNPPPPPQ